ncbi:fibronectin type III domain-containing protein [Aquimarina algiphila]|uniref:Fibronectin type-III domain-containing protein n=1 Tax=Aquimarina algiphila TaxID=2047982 RepID=A0A554VH15_9FLAO|nr:fibronectin type III domain-containing protein [Aquimarina algiphila]TSE06761.1 hypothetical protein FOF46_18265 [Aquimarina algiphila]
MRKLVLTLFILLYSFGQALAQRFPITVIPQVNPPAPVNFYNYADGTTINSPLRVQFLLSDITISREQIRLKVSFEGNGIAFESRDVVVGAPTLLIDGGIPLVLTNAELAPYFEFQNLQGINPNIYSRTIPEGSYQFCFEVFDFTTGNRLSSKTCASTYIFKNEPPILNLPFDGVNIEPKEVDNIVFQWTPRHINVSNVEYELSIVEIWDDFVDPQTAFLSLPPVFETTTRSTSFVYGPTQPLLLPEKRYAWRVRAKALQGAEEVGLFRNEGNSEIFWFSRTSPCTVPINVYAEPKGISKINVFWDEDPSVYTEYTIAYREANKPNAEWFTMRTNSGWATVWDLKPGTTYEYKVKGKCKYQYGLFSEIQEITTATAQDETANYNCGIVPDAIAITNREPHPNLQIGDRITAGDFVMTITELDSNNSGRITGRGYVKVPYFKFARFGVKFDNVLVNTDNQLAEGEIVTLYDPAFGEGEGMTVDVDLDVVEMITGDQGELSSAEVDFVIADIKPDENNAWVITGTNGEQAIVPGGQDVVIRDESGTAWTIGEDGTISQEQVADGGPVTEESTAGLANGDVSEISATGVRIDFEKSGFYAFDEMPNNVKEQLRSKYKSLTMVNGEVYHMPYKVISDIKEEDKIRAKATFSDSNITKEDIVFKTKEGIEVSAEWSGDIATLSLKKKSDYLIEEILATVKPKDSTEKYKIAGAFNLVHLGKPEMYAINLVIVPVNNANVNTRVRENINAIYNKAGVNFKITTGDRLQIPESVWDIDKSDQIVNAGESGVLNYYSKEEKAIHEYFKTQTNYNEQTYYLFVTDLKAVNSDTKEELEGFMPLKGQFGFVFQKSKDQSTTIAHELGHGVFGLEHPFVEYKTPEKSTEFLMDYKGGMVLNHMDWKKMHAPGFKLYWFQGDEEGEYTDTEFADKIFQIIRCAYINSNANDVISFDTSVFGKTGTFHTEWKGDKIWVKIDQGNFEGKSVYEPVEIGKNDPGNQPWRYSLLYKNVEIYTPRHSTGSDPKELKALREYLFPEDKSQFKREAEEILVEILNKNEFEDEDFEKIKSIANCGVQYFTAEQRYQIISKIVKSVNITEYYEDLILDLFETSPLEDITIYYDEFLGYLLDEDNKVLEELFADVDDAGVGVLWKGRENNYTRFINALADVTSKLDKDAKKWQIVNYIINNDYGDIEDVEKKGITTILASMNKNSVIADKVPAITELFINMLDDDDHCEDLKDYEVVFDIATLRNSNRELFASFTQSESTVLLNNEKVRIVAGKWKFSWVSPVIFEIRETLKGDREIKESELSNYYIWSKFLNEDQNKHVKDVLETDPSEYFQIFFDQLSKHFNNAQNDNNKFWERTAIINCDNRDQIMEHVNANENSTSLKNVDEQQRLELLVKMFDCDNWFDISDTEAYYENTEDVLMKLVTSFDPSNTKVLVTIEEIGLDKIYDKLSGKQLSKFLAWTGAQITNSGHIAESDPLEVLKPDGTLISKDDLLKLESNLFSFQNFSVERIAKKSITIDSKEVEYNQMVWVYVEGSFTFLDQKFKKGDVLHVPLVQAFAMSNSNRNIALGKGAWFAVDVVSLAFGVGSVAVFIKVGNTVRKVVVASDLLGSSAGMLANALNDDAISADMRFKLNILALVASLPQLATINKNFDNVITELDDKIDQARGLNTTSREVLEEHLEKITEKIGSDALKQADGIISDANKKLLEEIEDIIQEYDDPIANLHKVIKDSHLQQSVKDEIVKIEDYRALSDLLRGKIGEELLDLANSTNPELVAYVKELINARGASKISDKKVLLSALKEAENVYTLPKVVATEITNGSGGLGRIFSGEFDGNSAVFKFDRTGKQDYDTVQEIEDVAKALETYGGPKVLGRVRIQDTNGIWYEAVAMQRIDGHDLTKLKNMNSRGEGLPIQVTSAHLRAIDDLIERLTKENKFLDEVNLGDFMLTTNPDRVVLLDMFVKEGKVNDPKELFSNKPVRSTIEELIGSKTSLIFNLKKYPELDGEVAKLDEVLKPQFLEDFENASENVLNKLQDENLFDIWKNSIRSNDINILKKFALQGDVRTEYANALDNFINKERKLMDQFKNDPNKLEKVAKGMFDLRLETTTRFKVEKTPADLLEWIHKFNVNRYGPIGGNKWGHTWESIVDANKRKGLEGDDLYNKIISSSKTPLGDGDKVKLGDAMRDVLKNDSKFSDLEIILKKYRLWRY